MNKQTFTSPSPLAPQKANQPHIGIFGRRNTGKSSLFNYLLGYELALVSAVPGTTTDPVEKSVEIPPLGPVVLLDTAGIDDTGTLGALRTQTSLAQVSRVDLALLVSDAGFGEYEEEACALFEKQGIPFIVVWSKADKGPASKVNLDLLASRGITSEAISVQNKTGLTDLVLAMLAKLPQEALNPPPLLGNLLHPGSLCVFVAPIDQSAPRGRLISPQVQALRDCLDAHALGLVVQPEELAFALEALSQAPELLVCDSQAVHKCVSIAPPELALTTFSILMAHLKGDLSILAAGAAAISKLENGDKVCISEVCTHHAQADDIGRVKIPHLLKKFTGKNLDISFAAGKDYPQNLASYKLVIHCGACMVNRATMLARLTVAAKAGIPITNYGVAIALMHGVLERCLQIFPKALSAYKEAIKQ